MSTRRPRPRAAWRALALCAALLGAGAGSAQSAGPEPLSAFPHSLLAIKTADGRILHFNIWIADTPQRDQQGLMFVREMDDHAGMLFQFAQDQRVMMWMKNTYLSLDMLFVAADGRILYIARRTTPLSEAIISPPRPAHGVLELKGGIAEQFGIHEGDVLLHKSFGNAK